MDITKIYNDITNRLDNNGFVAISQDLNRLLNGASTGGEALDSTVGYLVSLKKNNITAYTLIKDLVTQYEEYCRSTFLK